MHVSKADIRAPEACASRGIQLVTRRLCTALTAAMVA